MPERPNPCPRRRPKPKAMERPLPEDQAKPLSIVAFDQMIYRPNTPEAIAKRNDETERRRVAKLATPEAPKKAIVMITHEYTPPDAKRAAKSLRIAEIMDRAVNGEITHEQATAAILEIDNAPARERVIQIVTDTEHRLSELDAYYMARKESNHANVG